MGLMEYLPGVQESVGCTEPAALALATSLAFKAVGGEIQRIWVKCDAGVIKNTYNVGVVGFDLSPFCNAVLAASMGAASGIIYLLGGSAECAARAISIIVANSAGAICDGAKPGCAIKVGTGASQALKTALLALSGVAPSVRDGIVGPNLAETLRSLARLGNIGMKQIEREVLNMMMG